MNWYDPTPQRYSMSKCSRGGRADGVLVLADIIKANDPDKAGKDAYRSARHKYEKGKLDKYKSACLCNIENPTNNLVSVLELW